MNEHETLGRGGKTITQSELREVLTNAAQLIDGWHADGQEEWTWWDEAVRKKVSDLLRRLYTSEPLEAPITVDHEAAKPLVEALHAYRGLLYASGYSTAPADAALSAAANLGFTA